MIQLTPYIQIRESTFEIIIAKNGEIHSIKLEPQIFQILLLLVEAKGELLEKEIFIDEIWEGNCLIGKEGLTKNIYKLRSILKKHQLDSILTIETIPKKGYRLSIHRTKIAPYQTYKKFAPIGLIAAVIIACFFIFQKKEVEEYKKPPLLIYDENQDTIIQLGPNKVHIIRRDSTGKIIRLDSL